MGGVRIPLGGCGWGWGGAWLCSYGFILANKPWMWCGLGSFSSVFLLLLFGFSEGFGVVALGADGLEVVGCGGAAHAYGGCVVYLGGCVGAAWVLELAGVVVSVEYLGA